MQPPTEEHDMSERSGPRVPPPPRPAPAALSLDARRRALEDAAELMLQAPSVHNTQPWRIELHDERLDLRADRSRQLTTLDPLGRELVISAGAALMNARIGLAQAGWDARCDRFPRSDDPDLLAWLWPVTGTPDSALALLAPSVAHRHTNRRQYLADRVPDDVLRRVGTLAEQDGAVMVPVLHEAHRRLLARLTQQADSQQNADPAYRAELRRWTTRPREARDGVPPDVVPRVDGEHRDDLPVRDFDTQGAGRLPPGTRSGVDQTLLVLATRTDEPLAWLEAGEALQRLLLELTALGWVAEPMTQAIEVPVTRTQLRSALTWDAHPQVLLRVGRAAPTPRTPRRRRTEAIAGSRRPAPPPPVTSEPSEPGGADAGHSRAPVSDGRGGTIWR
jgi:nitroreductase